MFLNRERKFASKHFFTTHTNSRKTVLEIAERLPNIVVRIIESDVNFVGDGEKMSFREIEFNRQDSLLDFLRHNQYTEAQIRNKMYYDV